MDAATWAALAVPVLSVAGAVLMAVVKMTRLVDAVERLGNAMEKVAGQVEDHEHRLRKGGL